MAISVHRKNLNIGYWSISGPNLLRAGLCNTPTTFFSVDPETVNTLSGTKASTFTKAQLDANFKFATSADVSLVAADFTDANWTAKGWTPGNDTTFYTELSTFITNNFGQLAINPNSTDVVLVIARGSVGGTNYSAPFLFFGDHGDTSAADSFTSLLMHLDGVETDSSTFAHPVTVFPTVTYVSGKFGQAADFSNSTSRITVNSGLAGSEFDFGSGNFTVECWLKALGTSGPTGSNQHFLNRWLIAGGDWYCVTLAGGANILRMGIAGVGVLDAGVGIPVDGNFHHVAYVREGTVWSIYKDGSRVAVGTLLGTMPYTSTTKVGVGSISDGPSVDKWGGIIDDVRISKGIARYSGTTYTVPTAPF